MKDRHIDKKYNQHHLVVGSDKSELVIRSSGARRRRKGIQVKGV